MNAREIAILVPDNLPSSVAEIDLKRRNTPPAVLQQIREIDPKGSGGEGGAQGGIRLDVTLNAPNRVFVRGRGLDLELGGTIRVTGPISDVGVTGAFELQRGRFQLLSRRLDFQRATLTFDDALVPTLDLLAASDTGQVTVYIAITGPANDPSFTFTSSPALPQDEVLARLIFGQGTADLSPLQIAQLASAAAQLSGVGGSTAFSTTCAPNSASTTSTSVRRRTARPRSASGAISTRTPMWASIPPARLDRSRARRRHQGPRGGDGGGGGEVGVFYEKEY